MYGYVLVRKESLSTLGQPVVSPIPELVCIFFRTGSDTLQLARHGGEGEACPLKAAVRNDWLIQQTAMLDGRHDPAGQQPLTSLPLILKPTPTLLFNVRFS